MEISVDEVTNDIAEQNAAVADVLLHIDVAIAFQIIGARKQLIKAGPMQVIRVAKEGGDEDDPEVAFLLIGQLDISKEIPELSPNLSPAMPYIQIPLAPSLPVLGVKERYYVFPQPQKVFLGVAIPNTVPDDQVKIFEDFLDLYSMFTTQADLIAGTEEEGEKEEEEQEIVEGGAEEKSAVGLEEASQSRTSKVAGGIEKGSKFLAKGLVAGATKGAGVMKSGGNWFKKHVKRKKEPSKVSDRAKRRAMVARKATGATVKVSGAVVKGVVVISTAIAREMGKALGETNIGQKLSNKSGAKTAAARDIGAASFHALANMLDGLEKAGKVLVAGVTDTTADVVKHRYGDEVGAVADDISGAVKNVSNIAIDVNVVTAKALTGGARGALDQKVGEEAQKEKEKLDPAIKMASAAVKAQLHISGNEEESSGEKK